MQGAIKTKAAVVTIVFMRPFWGGGGGGGRIMAWSFLCFRLSDHARRFVWSDLGPTCLQRLSVDDTSRQTYTTFTNFSPKYLVMCKVYTDVGGIK